jgi:serine/threonine protein kinase
VSPEFIAHYRITSKVGEGGMGDSVSRHRSKLNRDVAIKALPPAFAEDVARVPRFTIGASMLPHLRNGVSACLPLAVSGIVPGAHKRAIEISCSTLLVKPGISTCPTRLYNCAGLYWAV